MDKEVLVDTIKQWMRLEQELITLRSEMRSRREAKKKLTEHLVDVMKSNEIDCFDTKGGKILFSQNKVKKPINKKNLEAILKNYYKDTLMANELCSYILDNREVQLKENIRFKG